MKTLVTGGIRSGKSAHAEQLLADTPTLYVATGGTRPDDAAWMERVETHRTRRPATWRTAETTDVPAALARARREGLAVLLDDLGGWLTATLDDLGAWDAPTSSWRVAYVERRTTLLDALTETAAELVVVTGEVGYGLVSPYASGRLFTDELGTLNQLVATVCDRVVLVACGCPLVLKDPGRPS